MKTLQELIKASKFDSPQHKAYVNLIYTYHHFNNLHTTHLKKYKLLPQHYNILRIIKGKHPEPVTPSHILDVMLDKKRDLTRLLDKLEVLGYIKRTQGEKNKRYIFISLTDFALKNFEKLWQANLKIFHKLNDEESEILSNLLDKMRIYPEDLKEE